MLYRMLYITFFLVFLYSEELTQVYVETISNNIIKQKSDTIIEYTIESIENINTTNDNADIYIVHLNPTGFIILSGEDRAIPILGYSFNNTININNLPQQVSAILDSYKKSIKYIVGNNKTQDSKTSDLLDQYL